MRARIAGSIALMLLAALAGAFAWRARTESPAAPSKERQEPERARRTNLPRPTLRPDESSPSPPDTPIRFEAADVGLDFQYYNSAAPGTPGARMYEFTGGGVGVLDFDADGRPDLHFTQGCRWPPDPGQRTHLDRLYRNLGTRFQDVTSLATLMEPGFSQGVACGDFDGDGFADLYVANIGGNRLFRNNGDGTFADATAGLGAGPRADSWTVSVLIADLNGDALPDLFDVNYVAGDGVFDRICDHGGVPRICSPLAFEGQPDRLLLNAGDGTFDDVSAVSGIDAPDGTGLGIVAADFDGSGRLSLFVANDEQANHFYANETPSPGGPPRFRESGRERGLAFAADGATQACMGVAAGDSDGDGRLDLFVTNYVEESNTLYRGHGDGTFSDEARSAGLERPSRDRLGFGTQFLDADLDGREDLVVANGHVDDFTHDGYAYRMRPLFFRNLGGLFQESPPAAAGPYFSRELLGRGLARLDWNGDGRDDFAVSHLEDPAALLTNVTDEAGSGISFRLVATRSGRDAIGATVELRTNDLRVVRQLTAGDGYAASNERKLVFGLGASRKADEVTVRWPSGRRESFRDLAAGADWLLVEGRARPVRLATARRP